MNHVKHSATEQVCQACGCGKPFDRGGHFPIRVRIGTYPRHPERREWWGYSCYSEMASQDDAHELERDRDLSDAADIRHEQLQGADVMEWASQADQERYGLDETP